MKKREPSFKLPEDPKDFPKTKKEVGEMLEEHEGNFLYGHNTQAMIKDDSWEFIYKKVKEAIDKDEEYQRINKEEEKIRNDLKEYEAKGNWVGVTRCLAEKWQTRDKLNKRYYEIEKQVKGREQTSSFKKQ